MIITPRERECCEYLLRGWTNPEIAKKMRVELRTVKQYVNKLGIKFDIDRNRIPRIQIAIKAHEMRSSLGIRCQACGE